MRHELRKTYSKKGVRVSQILTKLNSKQNKQIDLKGQHSLCCPLRSICLFSHENEERLFIDLVWV